MKNISTSQNKQNRFVEGRKFETGNMQGIIGELCLSAFQDWAILKKEIVRCPFAACKNGIALSFVQIDFDDKQCVVYQPSPVALLYFICTFANWQIC